MNGKEHAKIANSPEPLAMTDPSESKVSPAAPVAADNGAADCRNADNPERPPSLPSWARLPINRCNLPAVVLGGLTFQRHPTPLLLDGVAELHADLFALLDGESDSAVRARFFRDTLAAHFCLDRLEEAGLTAGHDRRAKANWLRILRGWSFDTDGREGAVLKAWVESRFGLLPRFHGEPLRDFTGPAYRRYQEMRSTGLSGTNSLESQLDLLYTFCQYEFARAGRGRSATGHVILYRGINRVGDYEMLPGDDSRKVVLFNNLASFSKNRERADEFGDTILEVRVPTPKIFFHCGLLPSLLIGEDEYLVIGGAYEVAISSH
jgi:NAD+--dinitrogen-reductase ADP-D-ribosyltransferase